MTTQLNCPACHGGPTGEHGHAAMRAVGYAATFTCVSCLSPWRRTRAFDDHYAWEKLGWDPTMFDDPVPARAAARREGLVRPAIGAALMRLVRRQGRIAHAA